VLHATDDTFMILTADETGQKRPGAPIAGAANRPPPRDWFQLQRGTQHIELLGSRAVAEFLAEIGNHCCCIAKLLDHLDAWRELTPEAVAVAGGDRFPPFLTVVP